jgi:beta-glucosidase
MFLVIHVGEEFLKVSEDAYLGSQIAKAMVKGYQQDDLSKNNSILSCVKHFALYGASEAGRDYNTVDMSRIKCTMIIFLPIKQLSMQVQVQ